MDWRIVCYVLFDLCVFILVQTWFVVYLWYDFLLRIIVLVSIYMGYILFSIACRIILSFIMLVYAFMYFVCLHISRRLGLLYRSMLFGLAYWLVKVWFELSERFRFGSLVNQNGMLQSKCSHCLPMDTLASLPQFLRGHTLVVAVGQISTCDKIP